MKRASSLARNSAALATSQPLPIFPRSGTRASRSAAISLRGLGPEATLVLINGRRVAPYPVGVGGATAFVDLNSIPLAAIETIEVLKDGASALYGADAVAGVINLKMRRGIDGAESFASYGNTADKDSAEWTASVAGGVSNPTTSVFVGANYFRKAAIFHRDRAYSAVPPFLSTNASPANLELSRFAVAAALGQPVGAPIPGVSNFAVSFFGQSGADSANAGTRPASQYTFSPDRSSVYNYNEAAMSYPEFERKGALASLERKLLGRDNLRGFVDAMVQTVDVENQLAPAATGDFAAPNNLGLVIPARTPNPLLTVGVPLLGGYFAVAPGTPVPAGSFAGPGTQIVNGTAQRLAAPGAFNPFNPFNQDIADGSRARLAEFGNRTTRSRTEAFLFSTGVRGENVAGRWNLEAAFSYSSVADDTRSRQVSASRFNELLNAASPLFDPRQPAYLGTTAPYNPFGYYRQPIPGNRALAEYGGFEVRHRDRSSLAHVSAVASTADLFKLPAGSAGLAAGVDFRRELLRQRPDPRSVTGDLIGESPRAATNAQRKIGGAFLEGRAPLFRGVEGSAAVRHEKFHSSRRSTTVPKFALRVRPLGEQLTLRTSYSKGFREPSLFELYSAPISALMAIQDPLDGFVEPEQPITLRGNRALRPEKTDYLNAGFVWSPAHPRLRGLTLGADYWEIVRKGTVEANPQNTVYRAYGVLPGGLQPGESVSLNNSGFISVVNSLFFNVGRTKVHGWDFSGVYSLPTDTLGRWELTTVWTWIRRFDRAAAEGAVPTSVIGADATGSADYGYLEVRGRTSLSWAYRGFTVYLAGHYIDGFADEDPAGAPFEVADTVTVDAQVSYAFRDRHGPLLRDTKVSLGARNLLDRDPPRAFGGGTNSNGYPGFMYTAENLFWYAAVSRRF